MLEMHANNREEIKQARAGDIVALCGLKVCACVCVCILCVCVRACVCVCILCVWAYVGKWVCLRSSVEAEKRFRNAASLKEAVSCSFLFLRVVGGR